MWTTAVPSEVGSAAVRLVCRNRKAEFREEIINCFTRNNQRHWTWKVSGDKSCNTKKDATHKCRSKFDSFYNRWVFIAIKFLFRELQERCLTKSKISKTGFCEKPRLHKQFLCGKFYLTIFICWDNPCLHDSRAIFM